MDLEDSTLREFENKNRPFPFFRLCNPIHPQTYSKTLPTHPCLPYLLIYQLAGLAGSGKQEGGAAEALTLLAWMWVQLLDGPCAHRSYRADTREKSRKILRSRRRARSEKGSPDLESSEQTLVSSLLPKSKRDPSS